MPSLTSQVLSSNYVKFIYNQYQLNIYEKEKDLIEYELVFNARPLFNQISLPFTLKNLEGYYQPPLYEEYKEIPKGWFVNATHAIDEKGETREYRPINVVDSIAFYYVKSGNEYGTGKAFHLYRPLFIDAKGNQAYCNITYINNILTIIFPKDFLDKAVYPVVLDPSFGYTLIGGSYDNIPTAYATACRFQAPVDGTITKITAYFSGNTKKVKVGIWADNSGVAQALLSTSTEVTLSGSPSWFNFDNSLEITSGTYYWFGFMSDSGPNYYYDAGLTNQQTYSWGNTYPNLPNPFKEVYGPAYSNYKMSIFANYSVSVSAFTYSLSDTGIATDQTGLGIAKLYGGTDTSSGSESLGLGKEISSRSFEVGGLGDLTLMGLAGLYNFGETSIVGEVANLGVEIYGAFTYTVTSIANAFDVVSYTFQTTLAGDVKYLALVLAISAIALVLVGISNRR